MEVPTTAFRLIKNIPFRLRKDAGVGTSGNWLLPAANRVSELPRLEESNHVFLPFIIGKFCNVAKIIN